MHDDTFWFALSVAYVTWTAERFAISILKLEIMFVANAVIPIITDSYCDRDHLFNVAALNCDYI